MILSISDHISSSHRREITPQNSVSATLRARMRAREGILESININVIRHMGLGWATFMWSQRLLDFWPDWGSCIAFLCSVSFFTKLFFNPEKDHFTLKLRPSRKWLAEMFQCRAAQFHPLHLNNILTDCKSKENLSIILLLIFTMHFLFRSEHLNV